MKRFLKRNFAPYFVCDDFGTRQYCWTRKDAVDWLQYCGTFALVGNLYTGKTIALQSNIPTIY